MNNNNININPVNIAHKLENDANKKLGSFSLFYKKEKNIDAATLFKNAANIYNINKKYTDFLRCMITAAKLYEDNEERHLACKCYLESARIAQRIDEEKVEYLYKKHLELSDNVRHGEIYKEIGEFFKALGKYDEAIEYLTWAISDFDLNNRTYSINTCLDNICRIYINVGNFKDAGETLMKMSNNIKISRDNLVFTGILCFINHDPEYAKEILSMKYDILKDEDIEFLENCITYVINKDDNKLNDILDKFRFKFKVKAEHMNVVKQLKKIKNEIHENILDGNIDLT